MKTQKLLLQNLVNSTMKLVVRKVHPDLYQSYPESKTINAKSLAILNSSIEQIFSTNQFQKLEPTIPILFHMKHHTSNVKETQEEGGREEDCDNRNNSINVIEHKLISNCKHTIVYQEKNHVHSCLVIPPLTLGPLTEHQLQILSRIYFTSSFIKLSEKICTDTNSSSSIQEILNYMKETGLNTLSPSSSFLKKTKRLSDVVNESSKSYSSYKDHLNSFSVRNMFRQGLKEDILKAGRLRNGFQTRKWS